MSLSEVDAYMRRALEVRFASSVAHRKDRMQILHVENIMNEANIIAFVCCVHSPPLLLARSHVVCADGWVCGL
jgi:hypothetical protein